jgi:hypothetical protein
MNLLFLFNQSQMSPSLSGIFVFVYFYHGSNLLAFMNKKFVVVVVVVSLLWALMNWNMLFKSLFFVFVYSMQRIFI